MTEWPEQHAPIKAAHERFLHSLPAKAQELQDFLPGLLGAPAASQVMEEMRRRLHALYASAQVFQSESLADTVKVGLDRLDVAKDQDRRISQADIDVLQAMVAALPGLGGSEPNATEPPGLGASPTVVGLPAGSENGQLKPVAFLKRASHLPEKSRSHEGRVLQPVPPKRASGSFTAVPTPRQASIQPTGLQPRGLYNVLSVLVVDAPEGQNQVRAALPGEGFEVLGTKDIEEALRLARSIAPDVVVFSEVLVGKQDSELISRLRSDPLTDFVPVIALVERNEGNRIAELRKRGVDVVLPYHVQPAALIKAIREVTDTSSEGGARLDVIGKASPLEVFRRMTQEMERGLIDSLERGHDVRVDLGDGSDILASTWGAISRVRAELSKASHGQIRFRDVPRRGGPAMMALVDEQAESETPVMSASGTELALQGRRVLIVDDDPSVRWFFAGLMREEGAVVDEAGHGLEALHTAREHRPDIVISDILMPEMDGFALCRELKRDPGLSDVPVILLSWKDDFLQRMRELNSGASGYLRKEARSSQILERVREVLKPRVRLEERLRAGGEVRGRLEGIGIIPLLRTLAKERPDARFVLRDAWNLFEVDIRRGCLADLTRTATDGSFTRGEAALPQLLGATSGRFTISDAEHLVRNVFDEPLEDSLRRGTRWLGALMDAVSGTGLMHAASLTFNDEVMTAFMRTSPEPVRQLVQKLAQGQGPRELILAGEVAPQSLESVLVDLARRGALRSVQGPGGEDRVAMSLKERESSAHRDGGFADLYRDSLAGIETPEEPLPIQPHWLMESVSEAENRVRSSPQLPDPFEEDVDEDLRQLAEHTQRHISSYPPPAAARADLGGAFAAVSSEAVSRTEHHAERVVVEELGSSHLLSEAPSFGESAVPRPTMPEAGFPSEFVSSFDSSLIGLSERPPTMKLPAAVLSEAPAAPISVAAAPSSVDRATRPERPAARRKNWGVASWLWGMSLVLLGCIGFLGWRVWQLNTLPTTVARRTVSDGFAQAPVSKKQTPEVAAPQAQEPALDIPPVASTEQTTQPTKAQPFQIGERQSGIQSMQGVSVKEHQGLLVVQSPGSLPAARIHVDGRPLQWDGDTTRKEIALAAGQHELAVVSVDQTSYRFFAIHQGETRVIDLGNLWLVAQNTP